MKLPSNMKIPTACRRRIAGKPARLGCLGNLGRREQDDQAARKGQSLVEMALLLPLLVIFLSIVIEGGLALNAWIRVNTAARDATRFALDGGRNSDIATLVTSKLMGMDFGASREMTGSLNLDVFVVKGLTDVNGDIPNNSTNWSVTQVYNGNNSSGDTTRVTRTAISARLKQQGTAGKIPFVIVEVDFRYTPLLATLIARNSQLPMTSYAIIQQEPNN